VPAVGPHDDAVAGVDFHGPAGGSIGMKQVHRILGRLPILNLAPSRRRNETFFEEEKIELAPQLAAGFLINRSIEKLADVVNFLPHLHFNREASRVSQDLEHQPKILRNGAVLIEVQGLAFAGQVIELTLFLCGAYALFSDQVNVVHEWII